MDAARSIGSAGPSAVASTASTSSGGTPAFDPTTDTGQLDLIWGMLTPSDKAMLSSMFDVTFSADGTATVPGGYSVYWDMRNVAIAISLERSKTQSKAPLTTSMVLDMAKLAANSGAPLTQSDLANALGYLNSIGLKRNSD